METTSKDIKPTKSRKMLITAIVLLCLFLIYWVVFRPYSAVQQCKEVALAETGYDANNWKAWAISSNRQADYRFIYELCLQKEGINP